MRNSQNRKKNKINKTPNWLELPNDVWSLIFSKLYTTDIIENVQKVCMLFRKLCKQPCLYKIINMTLSYANMHLMSNANAMTRFAVDRSSGCLVDIYLEYVCDDNTLMYIVERSKNLKHLRLGHNVNVSDKGLLEAIKKLPILEEMEICTYCDGTIEAIGHTFPSLKSFSLNGIGCNSFFNNIFYVGNEQALPIAKNMPNLRKLQVIGNLMTNTGLEAILDGCPLLEYLDLRACFCIDLSGELGKRCGKIKKLRKPYDSTEDCSHHQAFDFDFTGLLDSIDVSDLPLVQ
ncbi:putative F-box/LRR-repeat protein 23 [Beta vulgaris subsp. vulgaris]|uniref:putative F-box/LRR-repeat protein 23 n=1 Tax=Beta vulgaris subsp. vulgaris TaxID=3555 RepID=UPI0020373D71|nr:putative F-box/LRR-repeat protein 23 [Beta vulgaris subsp. vulgaris]